MEKIIVKPGDRYGRLTVLHETEPYKYKSGESRQFTCKCDCGNVKPYKLAALRSGHTKSCGCFHGDKIRAKSIKKHDSRIGKTFGLLSIIGYEYDEKANRYKSICKCKCGNTTHVYYPELKSGHTKSCGCIAKIAIKPGDRFGRLTVLEQVENHVSDSGKKASKWKCKCQCGNVFDVIGSSLVTGNTQSCGCLQKDRTTLHGYSKRRVYKQWTSMKQRCENPNALGYENYGGRGISVCEKWQSFEGFWDDMGATHFKGASIERNDVDGDYSLSNCKWIHLSDQGKNKRTNRVVIYKGEEIQLVKLCAELGLSNKLMYSRIFERGWSVERAIETPTYKKFRPTKY